MNLSLKKHVVVVSISQVNVDVGILIPLCQASDTCTLREAAIICACLREHSIPPLHAAAGLLKIAEMDYNGVNSLFCAFYLRRNTLWWVSFEKKNLRTCFYISLKFHFQPFEYWMLVFHFLKFQQEKRMLPVLWHQSLLVFVSIYAADIVRSRRRGF